MTEESVPYVVAVHEPTDQRNHPVFKLLDRPIAFQRVFVTLTGSVTAALMLSQAVYWSSRTHDPKGWFYKTQAEWEDETGLTRREQESARKRLREFDWWQEDLRKANGAPVVHYRIKADAFATELLNSTGGYGGKRQVDMAESAKSISTKAPNHIQRLHPETTSENTTNTSPNRSSTKEVGPNPAGLDGEVDFYSDTDTRKARKKKENNEGQRIERVNPSLSQAEPDKAEEKEEPARDRDKEFEEIPGATDGKDEQQGLILGDATQKTNAFARQYKVLDNAPDAIRFVSRLVHEYTGFEPIGSKKTWYQQINLLWEAAHHSETILIEGLCAGELARQKNGLTYSGPRGYLSFVRNASAKPVKTVLRRSNKDPNRLGQTVRVDKQGVTRVRVNA